MKGDDVLPFLNCMPFSSPHSCKLQVSNYKLELTLTPPARSGHFQKIEKQIKR